MVAGDDHGNEEAADQHGTDDHAHRQAQVPAVAKEHQDPLHILARTHNVLDALESPGYMKERVSKWVVNVLILAVPNVLALGREPQVDDGLVVNVYIYLISVREAVVGVVFVAPPSAGEAEECGSHDAVEEHACLAAAVAVVVTQPTSLLQANANQQRCNNWPGLCKHCAQYHESKHSSNLSSFDEPVPFKVALRLELLAELSEGLSLRSHCELSLLHVSGSLCHLLELSDCLLGVQSVESVSCVHFVHLVHEFDSTRVVESPGGHVVVESVDRDDHLVQFGLVIVRERCHSLIAID